MEHMRYYIIGGQYESKCYGETESLRGAKAMASRNREYWDNHQGWHTPRIYTEDMVREVESKGRITTRDGETIIVPTGDCAWYHDGTRWVENKPQW